jgi:nitrogen regulatory protein P-II 1
MVIAMMMADMQCLGPLRTSWSWIANHHHKENTMKLIIAYIQPDRLNPVKQALYARKVFKISVTNALGCGQQQGYMNVWRGTLREVNLLKKIRLAIAVNDDFVETTIEGIIEGARTGHIGDGKIFVLPMEDCIRIRTGERGGEAIG